MIAASCAVTSASPFGSSRRRAAVAAGMRTSPRATARRRDSGLAPPPTICTEPASSTCERSLTAGTLDGERGGAVEILELAGDPDVDVPLAHEPADRLRAPPALPY